MTIVFRYGITVADALQAFRTILILVTGHLMFRVGYRLIVDIVACIPCDICREMLTGGFRYANRSTAGRFLISISIADNGCKHIAAHFVSRYAIIASIAQVCIGDRATIAGYFPCKGVVAITACGRSSCANRCTYLRRACGFAHADGKLFLCLRLHITAFCTFARIVKVMGFMHIDALRIHRILHNFIAIQTYFLELRISRMFILIVVMICRVPFDDYIGCIGVLACCTIIAQHTITITIKTVFPSIFFGQISVKNISTYFAFFIICINNPMFCIGYAYTFTCGLYLIYAIVMRAFFSAQFTCSGS